MAKLKSIEAFDCDGDQFSVRSRWDKWKRALEIYFLAADIESPAKKRATLLHTAGLALQEIYHNIPGAHVDVDDGVDIYEIAISKLDEYFSPKQSFVYERHLFRLLHQEKEEKFEKFLVRLRQQSSKCKFDNEDANLIDQIIEKCTSSKLKKRILLLGDTVTIDTIISEANALETVERQMNDFQNKEAASINKIDTRNFNINRSNANHNKTDTDCTRCGSRYHNRDSKSCPAVEKTCLKCGFVGHFKKQCRTRATKRKNSVTQQKNVKKSRGNSDLSTNVPKTSVDYIFHIDDDAVINCQIGGVRTDY